MKADSQSTPPPTLDRTRIERIFAHQGDTALRLRLSTIEERLARLKKLRAVVQRRREDLKAAGWADFRKPGPEVDLAEYLPIIQELNEAIRNLKGWMKPRHVRPTSVMLGTSAWVQHEPRGRCLIIAPWNYPVNLALGPLVSAIAAGNTVMLKPSEMTPHMSGFVREVVEEVFPEDEVAVFEGDAGMATLLLDLPFDHIFFTGSPMIGKVVMAAAAKHLTSVTLELGGKSPTIVDASADLDAAAANLAWSKFANAGQTCIAPDHIWVHESVREAFVAKFRERVEATYGATVEAQKESPDLARVVNQRHTQRLKRLIDDAVARGTKVLLGGVVDEHVNFVAPTLLDNPPADALISTEEIFGPIYPVYGFTDLQEPIRAINAGPKPLALYIWSRDETAIETVMKSTSSGGACINHSMVQFLHGQLPFGGVNNSGMGQAHGHAGFISFSHERAVVRTRIAIAPMLYPPYTDRVKSVIGMILKMA